MRGVLAIGLIFFSLVLVMYVLTGGRLPWEAAKA